MGDEQKPILDLTWEKIIEIEPHLLTLYEEAQGVKDGGVSESFCENEVWYGRPDRPGSGLKPRLVRLVGWYAERSALRAPEAYDIAYSHIYHALPACRNCACW